MIKTLGRLATLLLFICLNLSALQAGTVTSTVESKEILQGESVLLNITIVGEEFDTLPNIPRVGGAEVLSSTRSMKTRIMTVNGKATMEQTSVLMLEFKPTTDITIPAFQMSIDGEVQSTEPIEIKIVKSKPKRKQETKFLIEMNATKGHLMVGEPLIVNIYFKQIKNVDVMSIDYKKPEFKLFFSKRIGDENNYEDGEYKVHKLTYLLLAKEEGNLTINPATVKVAERVQPNQVGGWFSAAPKWSAAQSLSLTIQAKNPSKSFDAMGIYRLKESIDTQMVKINKPVNLKLIVEGEGSLEDFEGPSFDISGVTIYSDDAEVESKIIRDKLFSRYTKSYVFISDHDFKIPSKEISVYDYYQKKIKIIKSKAYNIVIDGASNSSSDTTVYTKNRVDDTASSKAMLREEITRNLTWNIPSEMMLFVSFLLGGVVALILRPFLSKIKRVEFFKSNRKKVPLDKALIILYPHMNESREVEEMVRHLYEIQQGKDIEIDRTKLELLLRYYRKKESDSLVVLA